MSLNARPGLCWLCYLHGDCRHESLASDPTHMQELLQPASPTVKTGTIFNTLPHTSTRSAASFSPPAPSPTAPSRARPVQRSRAHSQSM